MLGIDARVIDPTDAERSHLPGEDPAPYAEAQALAKLRSVAGNNRAAVVIAADTVVVLDGRVLGKPVDATEAARTLRSLSGRSHEVITAVAVAWRGYERAGWESTRVVFRELSEREIERYVVGREPLDKAGAYGIQGRGATLVRGVEGCFFNVVGLPLVRLLALLAAVGLQYDILDGRLESVSTDSTTGEA